MKADIVVGLQYGDEGKGKVAHQLARNNEYTHVLRYNGGCNAGHTIYHEGEKFVTHHIPCGVFYGIKSIIGPTCVIDVDKFLQEIQNLESRGIKASELVKIASNAHIITDFHRALDSKDEKIGTTKTGNGPAYKDKYDRRGVRALEVPELEDYLIDIYSEFHENPDCEEPYILCEGAQGFGLDIDWGDYPYVTSSSCTTSSVIQCGIPHTAINDVWGVAKMYETYVGGKKFESMDQDLAEEIRHIGNEYGSTTGRPRQVSWISMDLLRLAVRINGVNKMIVNKTDVLQTLGLWKAFSGIHLYEFESGDHMESWIQEEITECEFIVFSGNPQEI